MADDPRREALEAARDGVRDHETRSDVQAVRLHRIREDLQALVDRLDQHLDEWPDAPDRLVDLRDRTRDEVQRVTAGIEERVGEAAPNLEALLGASLAAALLGEAGSLDALARMPVSRVQVLGAKKAVLRAKQGADPPKHGVLFLHPVVQEAPESRRGDQAKALARLVVLAVRADVFTGRDLADELAAELGDLEP